MDILKYDGPVAIAGDCTKVRQRLTYSNDHGSHILGSTLPLDECIVNETEDITRLVQRVAEEKQYASQVRAILIKVSIPLSSRTHDPDSDAHYAGLFPRNS